MRFPAAILSAALLMAIAAQAGAADSREHRARLNESTLNDLARQNNSALPSIKDRTQLKPDPVPRAEDLVRENIASSLHRLQRETLSQQAIETQTDPRKVLVDAKLQRDSSISTQRPPLSNPEIQRIQTLPAP